MSSEHEGTLRAWWPVGLVAIVFTLYLAMVLMHWPPFDRDADGNGQLGDAFGMLTALFTGLAFAGLLVQIRLQLLELRLQREELAAQRREVKRLADAQDRAASWMAEQTLMSSMAALIQAEAFAMRHTSGSGSREFTESYGMLRDYVARELRARATEK